METRLKMYQEAIDELKRIEEIRVKTIARHQKVNAIVEAVLFAGMVVALYILACLTPALF